MPRRKDIRRVLVLGSGPIVIGQGCEFDYAGTQAVSALKEEGLHVILVNSNPATIMTDPDLAHRTYIEPLTVASVSKIIEREKPDVLLPTVGGQTALNLAVQLADSGVLRQYGVKLIGANLESIRTAEDRRLFRSAMVSIGLEVPRSVLVSSAKEAEDAGGDLGYPLVLRPSFTLGGFGGGIAYNVDDFRQMVAEALQASPIHEVLLEESLLGWKEFEMEVVRDLADNVIIVCSIENFDPMGVHTGDSITVAPAMTLTDREFQKMRDMCRMIIRRVGVETGGSNVQFAVHPQTGRMVVIEMNPRVSRSSALASKATGFPIARIAAKLAIGYTLDELPNTITGTTPACFEPSIDYVVVKIPRWDFHKFPKSPDTLTTTMRSVGETMAIGQTFAQALQKALRSLENGHMGLGADGGPGVNPERLTERLVTPNPERIFYLRHALQIGKSVEELFHLTGIDPFFVQQLRSIIEVEGRLRAFSLGALPVELWEEAKKMGFSDHQIAHLTGSTETEARARRHELNLRPVYKTVDTCAAEFEAQTPYLYGTYGKECESRRASKPRVIILGGGPNRIGQGIEFDYCCVHAVQAFQAEGFETIMVNNNPETVSTDYSTADKLYFEPLTLEDVLEVMHKEDPHGVVVQFGGQTPLNLCARLAQAGVPILGTSPDSIDLAEDRKRFGRLLAELQIPRAEDGFATTLEEGRAVAQRIGFPVLVRPSYVLGGRGMQIAYDLESLDRVMQEAARVAPEHPVLIDRFLEDAFEVDVDAVADQERVVIGGIMQHIEQAGVHSGDSACVLPTYLITKDNLATIRRYTEMLGKALAVRGLLNVQFAIKDGVVYVLEVNPRASRTVPFVSKAIGCSLARIAAQLMAGRTLAGLGFTSERLPQVVCVKEAVLPFARFPNADATLGPEMRSTGEVMGISRDFGMAFAKATQAAGSMLPLRGTAFVSVNDNDKKSVVPIARDLLALGFKILATPGTADHLGRHGLDVGRCHKIGVGRPNVLDFMKNGEIDLLLTTPLGKTAQMDEVTMRRLCLSLDIPLVTTLSGAAAAVQGIRSLRDNALDVYCLQDVHAELKARASA